MRPTCLLHMFPFECHHQIIVEQSSMYKVVRNQLKNRRCQHRDTLESCKLSSQAESLPRLAFILHNPYQGLFSVFIILNMPQPSFTKLPPHPGDALLVKCRRYLPIRSALLVNCMSFSTTAIYPFPLAWERRWDAHWSELFFPPGKSFCANAGTLTTDAPQKSRGTHTVSGLGQNIKPSNPLTLHCSC